MGLFYKYKCKNCGKKYTYLPVNCDCCGTELSFICPMDIWNPNAEYKQSKNCEEIFEIPFLFEKKARIRELERKVKRLEETLVAEQDEKLQLQIKSIQIERELDTKKSLIVVLKGQIATLNQSNNRYSALLRQYQMMEESAHMNIPQDTISAVRYAMKHAHPDNGGSAEDFVRFKKCYEELTGR